MDLSQFINAISQFVEVVYPPYDLNAEGAAKEMLQVIDPADIPFLTIALMKRADIWSYNRHFDGLQVVRRVKSEDIRDMSRHQLPELWLWLNQ